MNATFEDVLIDSKRQMESFGMVDNAGNRRKMRVNAIAKLKELDLAPWQWAALAAKAEELAKS